MKIVCFGDSITARKEGYPKPMLTMMLSEKIKGHLIVNAGVSGNTTVDALSRFKKDVVAQHPDVVTIMFGSNDCSDGKRIPLDIYKENLELFVKKLGYKKVILITPPPVDDRKQVHRQNENLQHYVEVVKDVAEEQNCTLIDFNAYVLNQENYEQLLIGKQDDGLHFGEKLYDQLSDLIAEQLKLRIRHAESSVWERIRKKLH